MSDLPDPVQLYLQVGQDPTFAMLHAPLTETPNGVAVLICPPFGWEEICSYRSRRDWAVHLAYAGHTAMRVDLPSTGDSGGQPKDPGRLGAWSAAVARAVEHLRSVTSCATVAAIGIGLGGLVLCDAIAEGAEIEDIVLWGVPARGRAFIREARAFARLEEGHAGSHGDPLATRGPDDLLVGGFLLSAETVEEIARLDLTQRLSGGSHGIRRALLLGRDSMAVDERLQMHLATIGASVTAEAGPGYGAMIAKPHHARAPRQVFATVSTWLAAAAARTGAHAEAGTKPAGSRDISDDPIASRDAPVGAHTGGATFAIGEIELDGAHITERALTVEQPFGKLFGILSEPQENAAGDLCAILLNAGAIRRVGPNRLWVEAARRWAVRGIPTLRLDLEGIGDADGDGERFGELAELYVEGLVSQVRAAIDELEARHLGPRFVVGGLCSGAYWSFHAALQDERIAAALLLNPRTLFWDASVETARELRRGVLRRSSWRKTLSGEVPAARLAEVAAKAPSAPLELARLAIRRSRARRQGADRLSIAFDRLSEAEKFVLLRFSGDEPLWEELERDGHLDRIGRLPNFDLGKLPGSDHTLRPQDAQLQTHAALDAAIERLAQQFTAI